MMLLLFLFYNNTVLKFCIFCKISTTKFSQKIRKKVGQYLMFVEHKVIENVVLDSVTRLRISSLLNVIHT